MIQLYLVGTVWLVVGLVGSCLYGYDLISEIREHSDSGPIIGYAVFVGFCVLLLYSGYGLLRRRSWVRLVASITSGLWLLLLGSYLLMVGSDYGLQSFVEVLLSVMFIIYSQIVIIYSGRNTKHTTF